MRSWKHTFYLVWTNNLITSVGMMTFLPLYPLYLREIGLENPSAIRIWSGLLVGGAPLTAALISPFWGALGDRVGRRVMLLRANFAITLFVGLMSLIPAPPVLLVLRLLQGVFSGFIAPSLTLATVRAPRDRQGRITGRLLTATLLGSLLGPLLGGFIGDTFAYRWTFAFAAIVSGLAGLLVLFFVEEPDTRQPPELSRERTPPRLGEVIAASVRDGVSFLGDASLRDFLILVFMVRFGASMIDPVVALYVEEIGGVPEGKLGTTSGLIFGATALATLLTTPFWGGRGDRKGHLRTLLICALGSGLFLLPQAAVNSVPLLYLFRLISGSFLAGVFPLAYALMAERSTEATRGRAHGITFASIGLANALGYSCGGVIAAFLDLRSLFFVASAFVLLAATRLLWIDRRRSSKAAAT